MDTWSSVPVDGTVDGHVMSVLTIFAVFWLLGYPWIQHQIMRAIDDRRKRRRTPSSARVRSGGR